mmetsp:Transcript_14156/g.17820  ORF Transcript_14156/g.17820 Transcript_14156/m.17820 type:complete len:104 (-) Transcript_14156:175-486(-)
MMKDHYYLWEPLVSCLRKEQTLTVSVMRVGAFCNPYQLSRVRNHVAPTPRRPRITETAKNAAIRHLPKTPSDVTTLKPIATTMAFSTEKTKRYPLRRGIVAPT